MGIGPISAIRPVSMIRPSPEGPDLSRVVEVEHLDQSGQDHSDQDHSDQDPSGQDEYTPADGKVRRGLEDEEHEGPFVADFDDRKDTDASSSKVSFVA
jgi:hypothetical protein